jgi:syntaxin 1B/2/3
MNDLLFAVRTGDGSGQGIGRSYGDPESGATPYPPNEADKEMQQFFQRVEQIKVDMTDIKSKQKDLSQQHERSKTIVRSKEMQRHREEMQVGHGVSMVHSTECDGCITWHGLTLHC